MQWHPSPIHQQIPLWPTPLWLYTSQKHHDCPTPSSHADWLHIFFLFHFGWLQAPLSTGLWPLSPMPQKCRAHQCLTQRENQILCSVISRATCLIYARQTTMSWFCTLGLASPMPTTCQSTGKNKEQGKHVVMTSSLSFPASGNQWLKDSVSKSWSPFLQIAPHGFFYVSYFLPWASIERAAHCF